MKLHHLALTIQNIKEIKPFYIELLGFKLIREYTLDEALAKRIFNINKSSKAFYLEGHDIALELFIEENPKQDKFDHWCLSFPDRELFIKRAIEQNASIFRIPRDSHDLIFIKDASKNTFEIKED